tara:strand:+ start:7728 stop:8063 length:336 start_codon:yes stop_codon:yes gene_type:complete
MKLYRSNNAAYLYVMRINYINRVYFGDPMTMNVINMTDKRRSIYNKDFNVEQLKKEYLDCCDQTLLSKYNSVDSLEYFLLYNKLSLKESIKDFSIRFGVYISYYNEVYNGQ